MLQALTRRRAPAFLASVTSAQEAELALSGGADVIDAKDPSKGALGALEGNEISRIVQAVAGRCLVSATAGDFPASADAVTAAAIATARAGADIVKVGFVGGSAALAVIAALGKLPLGGTRIVGVMMADLEPDFTLMLAMARAGFAGVMLDTADKNRGSLTEVLGFGPLREFLSRARQHALFCGLAGSLRTIDIAPLVRLQPDVLGFRGALCRAGRNSALDVTRVTAVRATMDEAAKLKFNEDQLMDALERPVV